jgi:hypothetical protein
MKILINEELPVAGCQWSVIRGQLSVHSASYHCVLLRYAGRANASTRLHCFEELRGAAGYCAMVGGEWAVVCCL